MILQRPKVDHSIEKEQIKVSYGLATPRGVIGMDFSDVAQAKKYRERQMKLNPEFVKTLSLVQITTVTKQEIIDA